MIINAISGAIIGDIIGAPHEFQPTKDYNFNIYNEKAKFTDDTVHTIGVAKALLDDPINFSFHIRNFMELHPGLAYGPGTVKWYNDNIPNNSFGNGAAMRVSAIGLFYNHIDEVLHQAKESAIISHYHPEGIKGAQAIASCVFLAKSGSSKKEMKQYIEDQFGYNLNFTIENIRRTYTFSPTCQDTVPEAIVSFLDSEDYESAIRNAISLGGDADTLACMAGGIAAAHYKSIPEELMVYATLRLPDDFMEIINQFSIH